MSYQTDKTDLHFLDNKEAIFNAWCSGHSLLYHIRRTCSCANDVTLDLCDLEGNIQHLSRRLGDYANTYMDGRRTYILVKVDKQTSNEPDKYTFLLQDIDTLHPTVAEKLKRLQDLTPHDRRRDKSKASWSTVRAITRVARVTKPRENSRRSSRDASKS